MLYPIYFHYPFTFHRGVGNLGVVQNSEHRLRVIVTLANVAIHFFAVETINEVATSGGSPSGRRRYLATSHLGLLIDLWNNWPFADSPINLPSGKDVIPVHGVESGRTTLPLADGKGRIPPCCSGRGRGSGEGAPVPVFDCFRSGVVEVG
jgi:hypothetical protein